jgi:hypothetical protein
VQNVQRITPFLRDIVAPAPLRDMPFWLCWRLEPFAGEAKPRKVPYYPSGERRHGVQGSPNDIAKLTTFAVARDEAMKRGMEGVGFAHTTAGGIVTLDFDNCVTDGKVRQDVFELVNMTYAEFSPSGNGIHAIFFGDPEILKNHKVGTQGDDFAVEAFSSAGFTTFTGRILDHVDVLGYEDRVAPLPPFVAEACMKRFGTRTNNTFDPDDFMAGREPRLGLTVDKMQALLAVLDPSMGREPWLRIGMALHHECDGDDTGFELWDDWSSDGDSYPSTEALRHQWDSFRPKLGKQSTTMRSVIKMAKEAGYREPDNREAVIAKAEEILSELPRKSVGRFGPVPIYDLSLAPPMDWIIKGVLPRAELGVLFGASGSGKTFVALDLAFSVARGNAWRDRRTARGRVVVIAAEGGAGIGKRGEAYARYHEFDLRGCDVHVITATPNFLNDDDISEVIAEINNIGPIDVIVTDTFAQVTPGANENTSEDMGRALANLKLLHEATGAMNLVVAHAGKDLSKGVRGWSGLKAAADVQIEVVRHENGDREIIIEKMKDGEDGLRWGFRLEVVEVGIDNDGDIITSCVAVPTELQAKVEQERIGLKRRGRVENHVLEIMTLFGDQSVVAAVDLIDRAVAALQAPEDGKRDTRRQSVTRAIQALSKEKDGPLRLEGGKIIFYE